MALDAAALERLALDYVARYATTRARLATYLRRKLRERGWSGAEQPDLAAIADRLAAARYIDDAAFARGRAESLTRRGYGRARVRLALDAAGIDATDREDALAASAADAQAAALAFARRRRIGPFGDGATGPDEERRALAAMIRAGHDYRTARAVLTASPDEARKEGED